MGVNDAPLPSAPRRPAASERLDSWKEIAAYVKRDESTVRRWEEEGLPVHRHAHKRKATVYAYKSEIDNWWNDDRGRLEAADPANAAHHRRALWWATASLTLLVVVALGLTGGGVRNRLFGPPRAGEIASIAVLPLKNLSGDSAQDYFADGTTEALITELGKISALQVLSYQSVIGYRQTSKSLPEIARELKVDALLEGAVLPSGDRFRITANLIQAAPERHLWAEHFEFKRRDILEVQAQVAREVATQVHVKLTPDEQRRLSGFRPIDPEVHEAYLLGRAYLYKAQTSTNWMRAKEYFQKAIEQDPGYGRAYASLAELWMQGRGSSTNNTRELRVNARQWAEKALQLDPMLAEAHTALARVSQQEWDWAAAEREYQRAITLNPSYAPARIRYAMYLYATERFEEAAAQAKRAQQLEPTSPFINTWAATAYLFAGRSEDGMTSLRKALELDPSHSDASIVLARTYAANGMYNQAIDELERALRFNERESLVVGALASEYARSGRREEAFTQLAKLKRMQAEPGYVAPFGMIWAYAGVGDNDAAFAWLERAYDEHRDRMVWLNVDPLLDPLRSDPRFDDLVRRTGLPTGITRLARANSIAFTHGGDQAKPK